MHKLFIPYIMGNQNFIENVKLLSENGADYIEIGIPFSDPVADGAVILKAGQTALEEGMNAKLILERLKLEQHAIKTPYLLMTYYNIIESFGVKAFIDEAEAAGVYGLIIPDLPYELGVIFKEKLKHTSVKLISLIAMTTSNERVKAIASEAEGFIYTVTMNAVTGQDDTFHQDLYNKLSLIKQNSDVPVVSGFGIKSPEQIEAIKPYCDGIVIGSEIVRRFTDDTREEVIAYLKNIRKSLDDITLE